MLFDREMIEAMGVMFDTSSMRRVWYGGVECF